MRRFWIYHVKASVAEFSALKCKKREDTEGNMRKGILCFGMISGTENGQQVDGLLTLQASRFSYGIRVHFVPIHAA